MRLFSIIYPFLFCFFFLVKSYAQDPQLLMDIFPGSNSGLDKNNRSFVRINETVFFAAGNGFQGYELYKEENGVVSLVKDIYPGNQSSNPVFLGVYKDKVYFTANDGVHVQALWVSDGTEEGTSLYYATEPGPISSYIFKGIEGKNGAFYFASGEKLYKTFGVKEDIQMITCPHPMQLSNSGNGSPRLIPFENGVVFAAESTLNVYVYKTGGDDESSVLVTQVAKTVGSSTISALVSVNDKILFAISDFSFSKLYSTEGEEGSVSMAFTNPSSSELSSYRFIPFKDDLVLLLSRTNIFGINGIPEETVNLGPLSIIFQQGVGVPSAVLDNKVYFRTFSSGGFTLYVSDGTQSGTKIFYNYSNGTLGDLVAHGGYIYFTAGIVINQTPKIFQFDNLSVEPEPILSFDELTKDDFPSIQIIGFKRNQMYFSHNLSNIGRELYLLEVDVNSGNQEAFIPNAPYLLRPHGERTFQFDKAEMNDLLELQLMDLQGKLIWSDKVYGNDTFQLPDLQGIYILYVKGTEGVRSFKVPVWR